MTCRLGTWDEKCSPLQPSNAPCQGWVGVPLVGPIYRGQGRSRVAGEAGAVARDNERLRLGPKCLNKFEEAEL